MIIKEYQQGSTTTKELLDFLATRWENKELWNEIEKIKFVLYTDPKPKGKERINLHKKMNKLASVLQRRHFDFPTK